jgi:hypothetical protein
MKTSLACVKLKGRVRFTYWGQEVTGTVVSGLNWQSKRDVLLDSGRLWWNVPGYIEVEFLSDNKEMSDDLLRFKA